MPKNKLSKRYTPQADGRYLCNNCGGEFIPPLPKYALADHAKLCHHTRAENDAAVKRIEEYFDDNDCCRRCGEEIASCADSGAAMDEWRDIYGPHVTADVMRAMLDAGNYEYLNMGLVLELPSSTVVRVVGYDSVVMSWISFDHGKRGRAVTAPTSASDFDTAFFHGEKKRD